MELIGHLFILIYSLDILLLFLFGVHSYLMVYLYRRNHEYCNSGNDPEHAPVELTGVDPATLPVVTIQLPIFNEFYVIDRLLRSTVSLEWPQERLEIQVLDDSTDETREKALRLVEFYRARGFDIHHIHRVDRVGHKAGALKAGLEICRGEFVAIFDADFLPTPNFLRATIPYFNHENIGMVQTRWGHINDDYSVLTKAQSFGIDGHFMIEQVARNCNNLWMNFNGTGGIWRKECIFDSGNWQGDTLTEDFDLSYRAMLAGWDFRYFKNIVNPAELPVTISAFKSQQFRWCKGSIQTAVKLIPSIIRSKYSKKIKGEAIIHLINYSVHPLMIINILFTLPLLLMKGWFGFGIYDLSLAVLFAAATLLSIGTFGPTAFYMYSQRELYSDWRRRIIWLPILMMIGTGIAVNNTRAWLEAILGIKSSFKRTPKYGVSSKGEKISSQFRYRLPFDPLTFGELFMGTYCLVCLYFSITEGKPFIIPFMVLYSAGFFYVGIKSLVEFQLKKPRSLNVAENEA